MKSLFAKNNYRFGVETLLSIYLSKYQFVLGADLESYSSRQDFFDDENPCNIYFVLRRPKVTIDPNSVKIKGKTAKFDLFIHCQDKVGRVSMGCEFKNSESKIEFRTEYPFNTVLFWDQQGALMLARLSTLLDSNTVIRNVKAKDLDYEILYIGQSYGKDGKRTAIDRLSSHETVQKIYTHASMQFPESDIWIMLTNFSEQSMLFSAGADIVKVKENDKKIEEKKLKNFFKNKGLKLTERQRINLTEAALIRYFEPEYNLNFKENFPSPNHKSYSDCYKLDIRSINIEIGMQDTIRKIYTKKSGRKSHHSRTFEFSSDNDRISFLNFMK